MAYPFEHLLVHDDGVFRVSQDWECPIPGFMVVSTVREVRSFDDLSQDEAARFGRLVRAVRAAQRALGFESGYVFEMDDSEFAFHVWLLPRQDWMEPFIGRLPDLGAILRHAKAERMDRTAEVERVASRIQSLLAGGLARGDEA